MRGLCPKASRSSRTSCSACFRRATHSRPRLPRRSPRSDAAEDALFEELHEHLAAADDPLAEPAGDETTAQLGPDMKAAEEIATEQVTAVLTGVLDRLGAAHHRPFSRS